MKALPVTPEECALLSSAASEKRQEEFRAGRACARHALLRLGGAQSYIGADSMGCPEWPAGVVGSITHTEGWAAAAIGKTAYFRAIGIDAEMVTRMTRDIWGMVFTREELTAISSFYPEIQPTIATILFSAKESFFKAQYPITKRLLEFTGIAITLNESRGTFSVALRNCAQKELLGRTELRGNYTMRNGLVVTSIAFLR